MSRLERLVVLLDTGSTQFIRNTAADQLSDLAKGHPEEILNFLGRVYPYLKSKKWETRIAAARAIGGIVNHAELWDPNEEPEGEIKSEDGSVKTEPSEEDVKIKLEQQNELELIDDTNLIAFSDWQLADILNSGKKLLASGGTEFDQLDSSIGDPLERLKRQKSGLNARLGMGGVSGIEDDLLEGNDVELTTPPVEDIKRETTPNRMVKSETPESIPGSTPTPTTNNTEEDTRPANNKSASSARLRAMARRKAKADAKSSTNKIKPVDISQSSISRQLVKEGVSDSTANSNSQPKIDITSQQGGEKLVVEHKAPEIPPLLAQHARVAGLVWPFQGVYELLIVDLFADDWETRHGAALGIRELVKKHGNGAGRVKTKTRSENDDKNSRTLEDLAVRICTLFALDRFGDYVSDTVVAPVRESSAQALAALLIHLNDEVVIRTFTGLTMLVLQDPNVLGTKMPCWEASHGGMLGLRYFVGVRTDILFKHPELLNTVVGMVLHGLKESDDDVQAVAAATLTPIASDFVKMNSEVVKTIVTTIWDCLTNLKDDLSASIGSVMDLLAKLCTHKEVLDVMKQDANSDEMNSFEFLVPRLFPFLRHSISNVRKAVLRTLLQFLSIDDKTSKRWINSKSLRLLFQNLLVEQNQDVLDLSVDVYSKIISEIESNDSLPGLDELFTPHSQSLLTLLMTPIGIARHNYKMNTNLIIRPSGSTYEKEFTPTSLDGDTVFESDDAEQTNNGGKRGRKRKQPIAKPTSQIPVEHEKINIDAAIFQGDVTLVGTEVFVRTRIAASKAFGQSLSYLSNNNLKPIWELILHYLEVVHATPRLFASMTIQEYTLALKTRGLNPTPETIEILLKPLTNVLEDNNKLPYFRELVPTLKSVRTQCLQLFAIFVENGKLPISKVPQLAVVVQGELEAGPDAFGVEHAEKIIGETYARLLKSLSATYRLSANQAIEDAKHRIAVAVEEANIARNERVTGILASYAGAVIALKGLPPKLNPIIRSLMDSVKSESLEILQYRAAKDVASLVQQLTNSGKTKVSDKIVNNLCSFLCVDTSEVPEFQTNIAFTDVILSLRKDEAITNPEDLASHERAATVAKIKRNGGKLALESLLSLYGEDLFTKIPKLRDLIIDPITKMSKTSKEDYINDPIKGQSVVDSLGVMRALTPKLHKSLLPVVYDMLPLAAQLVTSEFAVFRYSIAKCLATLSATVPSKAFPFIVKIILPMFSNAGEVKQRQGAIECIYHLCLTMGSDILPYIVFLIVPVLGRMSDSDRDVRVLATTTFAAIIKLVPLEAGIPDPEDMPQEFLEGRDREREFIHQMMDPSNVKPFDLPVSIKATLRKYQQEGVNWLAFLNKYHLHGILCDDMGLGKTLQTICIVSSDHHMRADEFEKTGSDEFRKLPSLVICPPSLTGHWEQEINQYAPFMKVLVYAGGPSVRSGLRSKFTGVDVVVTSYDVVRNDVEFVTSYNYNYCVLDEGHIIKNAASKLTKCVKRVAAEHRLILSGTPIQNNVLELWSLFDFLMPGFLGTEKIFHEKFAKPIAASRNSKVSSKEQEAGALALESLHKQTLPFMLRRLKEEVLSDLPPKIIQDYYCELSDLQKRLYKDFAKKKKSEVEDEIQTHDEKDGKGHIFQMLQYMRKLCNHPALVVTTSHPQYDEVQRYLSVNNMDIRDIRHAPKLLSLQTLLLECGIGETVTTNDKKQQQQQVLADGVISQHRALIFCQLKDMLDLIENDLFKKFMPSVTYMRLDGSTDPRLRQDIVRKFNGDPSIDVLLLTTKVGGLGLNLTGADTVIFVEHDWNPMNDLQAMDRTHRLGQKKVVNVYRLITKGTLEEKIMGLQKFKMNIASTIINQQNTGLTSMDTNQLLDLFNVDEAAAAAAERKEKDDDVDVALGGKAGAAVGELAELWDESQYEEEYNLDNFIKTLK